MKWIAQRFKEPSTWAGLAGLVPMLMAMASGPVTPHMIGGLVAGAAAVFMPEQGKNA